MIVIHLELIESREKVSNKLVAKVGTSLYDTVDPVDEAEARAAPHHQCHPLIQLTQHQLIRPVREREARVATTREAAVHSVDKAAYSAKKKQQEQHIIYVILLILSIQLLMPIDSQLHFVIEVSRMLMV